MDTIRKLHRLFAFVLGAFVIVHIVNHLMALAGVENHIAFMELFRLVYRYPPVEILLLVAVIAQILLGLRLLVGALKYPASFHGRLQLLSGTYLIFFLVIHVSAILFGRWMLGLDTSFYFAVAGYQYFLTSLFFIPYYFLAIVAFFVHIGCALYWKFHEVDIGRARLVFNGFLLTGLILSAVISSALMGLTTSFEVPAKYLKSYAWAGG